MKKLQSLIQARPLLPLRSKALTDLALWATATPLAFLVRYDGSIPSAALTSLIVVSIVSLVIKAVTYSRFRLYKQMWSKVSFYDLKDLVAAVSIVTAIQIPVVLLLSLYLPVPRSVPLLDGAFSLLMLFVVRAAWRYRFERRIPRTDASQMRVLIIGAGETGALIAKEMLRNRDMGMVPLGFVDDDPKKQGLTTSGLPVLGGVDSLPDLLSKFSIDRVLISAPSAGGDFIRRVVTILSKASTKVDYRVMPGVYELMSGDVSLSRIREIRIEDLLRRPSIQLELGPVEDYIQGEVVLVTGAGGSIGGELARQLCKFRPRLLVLLGRGENSIHQIEGELNSNYPGTNLQTVIADVRNRDRMRQVLAEYQPTVVFHAAAHKHVRFMERHPEEAVQNNIVATRNLAELSLASGVKRFVNISTDKAVNPTSIMGSSKRVAEGVVQLVAAEAGPDQRFVSVRFGNVLGSRGSVLPIFTSQIARGGPVTITDAGMTRYFMTIPEASQLVLDAGAMGENGAIYILDMGEPVKIVDLAEDLIRLSGLEPHVDIPISFTGARPGEKLSEELMTEAERANVTNHDKIFIAHNEVLRPDQLRASIARLERAAQRGDKETIRHVLQQAFIEA